MKSGQARDNLPKDEKGIGTIPASEIPAGGRFPCPPPKALQKVVIGDSEIERPHFVNLLLEWSRVECHPSIIERLDDALTYRLGSVNSG
jgi:hypothetical protein